MRVDDPRHGTYAGGRVHRADDETVCAPCRDAEARYEQARQLDILNGRPRTLPPVGTQRRLQALVALGHSFARIGDALAMTTAGAHHLATRPRPYVRATTATKVATLYEAWSMRLPPETSGVERKAANYARTVARKHDWVPPLAWDDIDRDDHPATADPDIDVDPVVVERILAGDLVATTTTERRAVVAAWPSTGRSYADLTRLTGWKVERYHHTQREDDAA